VPPAVTAFPGARYCVRNWPGYDDGVISKHLVELAHPIQHKMSGRGRASDHHRAGVGRGGKIHLGRDLTGFVAGDACSAFSYTEAALSQMAMSFPVGLAESAMKSQFDSWMGILVAQPKAFPVYVLFSATPFWYIM
jgi:hypothetical protein